jgi:5-methylcytosine-specific restriction enzyme subunit McrC
MLATASDLSVGYGEISDLDYQSSTLLEIIIGLFATKLTNAVRRGLPRQYNSFEEDLPTLRGRLRVSRQVSELALRPGLFACRYDELSPDTLISQVLKTTVHRLTRVTRSARNSRMLRELGFIYEEVAPAQVSTSTFKNIVLDRTNSRWREVLELAKMLLGGDYQTTTSGAAPGFSLLFNMHELFEAYVAKKLARVATDNGFRVVSQGGHLNCLRDHVTGNETFRTMPDIIIWRKNERLAIVDTKWKAVDPASGRPKAGVSQGDVYQMMAYGSLYRCSKLWLLYPDDGQNFGTFGRHRIINTERDLITAALDISDESAVERGLSELLASLNQ